jgi:hypothetical protein
VEPESTGESEARTHSNAITAPAHFPVGETNEHAASAEGERRTGKRDGWEDQEWELDGFGEGRGG